MNTSVTGGTVKFFNERRRFGFVRLQGSSEEVYFHLNDCERVSAAGNGHSFCGRGKPERMPRAGDLIILKLSTDGKGRQRAAPWGLPNNGHQVPVMRPKRHFH